MEVLAGSILTLKILTDTNTRAFLKNMDNKFAENQRKTASSSYPHQSLSKWINPYKACIYKLCRDFLDGVGYDLGTKHKLLLSEFYSKTKLTK